MGSLQTIKGRALDYAKDICLSLNDMISRSSLEDNDAVGVALVVTPTAKSRMLTDAIHDAGVLSPEEVNGALTVAAFMGMNNVWYPYIEMANDPDLAQQEAELCINAYVNDGDVDKCKFEICVLAVSIIGKCHFCIKSHYDLLEDHQGISVQ